MIGYSHLIFYLTTFESRLFHLIVTIISICQTYLLRIILLVIERKNNVSSYLIRHSLFLYRYLWPSLYYRLSHFVSFCARSFKIWSHFQFYATQKKRPDVVDQIVVESCLALNGWKTDFSLSRVSVSAKLWGPRNLK